MRHLLLLLLNLATLSLFAQNKIKFYKIELKASDILPNGREWGPQTANQTIMFTKAANSLDELLGQTYTTKNMEETHNFLNTDIAINSPLLDSINFFFYYAYGMPLIERQNPSLLQDSGYLVFKYLFSDDNTTIRQSRNLFKKTEYRKFKNLLEDSRFDVYGPPITITVSSKINNSISLAIGGEITADIEKNFTLKPGVEAKLKDSISRNILMNNAQYHEIRLNDDYVQTASTILLAYKEDSISLLSLSKVEIFAKEFQDYLKDEDAAIITGAAVLEAEFDAKKVKNLNTVIGATINGNLDATPNSQEKIASITAEITAKYLGMKEVNEDVKTTKTFYYLRYIYDKRLNIGIGAEN